MSQRVTALVYQHTYREWKDGPLRYPRGWVGHAAGRNVRIVDEAAYDPTALWPVGTLVYIRCTFDLPDGLVGQQHIIKLHAAERMRAMEEHLGIPAGTAWY